MIKYSSTAEGSIVQYNSLQCITVLYTEGTREKRYNCVSEFSKSVVFPCKQVPQLSFDIVEGISVKCCPYI